MGRFDRLSVYSSVEESGLVPLNYNPDVEVMKKCLKACASGGATVFEFTNRGDFAHSVFSELHEYCKKELPWMILGVGSVLDPGTASLYISIGANFIVGSVFNEEVARICNRRKVGYMPGCMTPSEISKAEESGADIVKLFPGSSIDGPDFVKSIKGPTPWSKIMVTGGVKADRDNIKKWFDAGVTAIGMGSAIFRNDWIAENSFEKIEMSTKQILSWIREIKGKGHVTGIEHVGLSPTESANAEKIVSWYSSVFGLKATEGNSSYFLSGSGPGRIEVMKRELCSSHHIAVEVYDYDAAVMSLKEKGIKLGTEKIRENSKSAFLEDLDPAGNSVHILWRKEK